MALKPCRECGRPISTGAKVCPNCGTRNPIRNDGKTVLIAVVLGAFVCYGIKSGWWNSTGSVGSRSESSTPTVGFGQIGRLTFPDGKGEVGVATSEDNYDRQMQLLAANDREGWQEMVAKHQIMLVDSGTKCRIIDVGFSKDEVRILEGDFSGESGFVPVGWVKP